MMMGYHFVYELLNCQIITILNCFIQSTVTSFCHCFPLLNILIHYFVLVASLG